MDHLPDDTSKSGELFGHSMIFQRFWVQGPRSLMDAQGLPPGSGQQVHHGHVNL